MNRNRFTRLVTVGALVLGLTTATATLASNAGAQAIPSTSCTHGATGTQVGEQSINTSNVLRGFRVSFSNITQQSHSQMLCGSGGADAGNKTYFGIQLESPSNGKYVFFGIGTRAGEYDCGLTGAGIGHVVFAYSGGLWYGLSNDHYGAGTDSHGCSSSNNFSLQIVKLSDGYWHLQLVGNVVNDVIRFDNSFLGSDLRAKIIDGVGYGGNSNMYGQNNGSDYLHAHDAVVDTGNGNGWFSLTSHMGGLSSFTTGTYTGRFAEGGITDGMNAYTNSNGS